MKVLGSVVDGILGIYNGNDTVPKPYLKKKKNTILLIKV